MGLNVLDCQSHLLQHCHPVNTCGHFFFFFFFFNLTYSRWTSSLPSCLLSQRIFPSLPGSRLTIFLSRCKFSTLTTRQPMVEFYLLTLPRFPLRKKEHKSYFGKNRTHDFRTNRCADYLLDHSGDEGYHEGSSHLSPVVTFSLMFVLFLNHHRDARSALLQLVNQWFTLQLLYSTPTPVVLVALL